MTQEVIVREYTLEQALKALDPKRAPDRDDMASIEEERASAWDLNAGYDESFRMARFGWTEQAHRFSRIGLMVQEIATNVPECRYDVTGDSVDVGRFLEGEPECMLNYEAFQKPTIVLRVNIGARCYVNSEILLNRGVAVAAAAVLLESMNYPVKIVVESGLSHLNDGTADIVHQVTLNEPGEYVDAGRLAFWLAHPAAFRRSFFRLCELESEEIREHFHFNHLGGYSYPSTFEESKKADDGAIHIYVPFLESCQIDTPAEALQKIIDICEAQGLKIRERQE